ncbi:MAG: flagellar basal body-associated FliL family protein [Candidatus Gastranaerophilales bacterium]|nr:flagellar basal body-associated FliL family protein [Candidatus Gastranaerophilales bacterium]
MVRPTRPKEIKPKAEITPESPPPSGGTIDSTKFLIINTITTVVICMIFMGTNYFIQDNLLSTKLSKISNLIGVGDEEETVVEEEEIERGHVIDLGEFILNLSDPTHRRYLKVNVAIEISKTQADIDAIQAPAQKSGGHGGHGAPAANSAETLMGMIEVEMKQYKPFVRDAIISTLSSKTAEELSSVAGKELAKEQIKEAVDAIFAGDREVLRVSFGDFIIQ